MAIEKEKGIQGAILRRGCNMTLDGKVGEERAYFIGAHFGWVPPHAKGLLAIDISKARQAGLAFRPLADTIRDTFQWATQRAPEASGVTRLASGESTQAGLEQARETVLLQDWHTHQ